MSKDKETKEEMTTIRVRKVTTLKLLDLGKMGDTYDAVISKLLNGKKPGGKGEPRGDE